MKKDVQDTGRKDVQKIKDVQVKRHTVWHEARMPTKDEPAKVCAIANPGACFSYSIPTCFLGLYNAT